MGNDCWAIAIASEISQGARGVLQGCSLTFRLPCELHWMSTSLYSRLLFTRATPFIEMAFRG